MNKEIEKYEFEIKDKCSICNNRMKMTCQSSQFLETIEDVLSIYGLAPKFKGNLKLKGAMSFSKDGKRVLSLICPNCQKDRNKSR